MNYTLVTVAPDEGEQITAAEALACAEGHAQAATLLLNEYSWKAGNDGGRVGSMSIMAVAQAHAQAATAYALIAAHKERGAQWPTRP